MLTINCSIDENGNFIESSNGNGSVESGGIVKWVVTGSRLDTISISPKIVSATGDSAIWAIAPRPYPDNTPPKVSKNWQGTVIETTTIVGESYDIGHVANSGASGSHDPRISVNP